MNFRYTKSGIPTRIAIRLRDTAIDVVIAIIIAAVVLFAAIALGGCAGMQVPADPSRMTADQLKALASDRSAIASCTVAAGPWGTGRTVYVQLDRATIPGGTVTITPDCQVSATAEQKRVGQ